MILKKLLLFPPPGPVLSSIVLFFFLFCLISSPFLCLCVFYFFIATCDDFRTCLVLGNWFNVYENVLSLEKYLTLEPKVLHV